MLLQHCFEIYSNDGLIKACKLDSDGKVVEGQLVDMKPIEVIDLLIILIV